MYHSSARTIRRAAWERQADHWVGEARWAVAGESRCHKSAFCMRTHRDCRSGLSWTTQLGIKAVAVTCRPERFSALMFISGGNNTDSPEANSIVYRRAQGASTICALPTVPPI